MADSRLVRLTVSAAWRWPAAQCGAGDIAILPGQRDPEVGEDDTRILLERQLHGIAEAEFEWGGFLGEGADGQRQ